MHSITFLKTGVVAAALVLAAGCADMRAPAGNQTSYATGSYRMPPKADPAPAQRSAAATDSTKIQAAQRALARAGYNPGSATGAMDGSTHDALVQFQRARGLRATGDLDSATMAALGVSQ
jgi:peptidoglycan hydrolase-like protein with peptidoglycan-binding domain